MYKSVRNLGFEITCLHKVNKGIDPTSLASFSRTQSSGTIQEFDLRIYSVLFRNSSYYCCFTTHLLIIITKLSLQLIAVIRNVRSSGRTHFFGPTPITSTTHRVQTEISEAIRFTTRMSKPDSLRAWTAYRSGRVGSFLIRPTSWWGRTLTSILSFFKWRQRS